MCEFQAFFSNSGREAKACGGCMSPQRTPTAAEYHGRHKIGGLGNRSSDAARVCHARDALSDMHTSGAEEEDSMEMRALTTQHSAHTRRTSPRQVAARQSDKRRMVDDAILASDRRCWQGIGRACARQAGQGKVRRRQWEGSRKVIPALTLWKYLVACVHGVMALRLSTWLSVERAQQDRDRSGVEMLSS